MIREQQTTGSTQNHMSKESWHRHRGAVCLLIIIILYVPVWLAIFYLTPDQIYSSELARQYAEEISSFIKSIGAYARNSPDPHRIGFFLSLQWSFDIFLICAALIKINSLGDSFKLEPTLPRTHLILGGVLLALMGIGMMVIPESISLEKYSRFIRWYRFLHESLFASALNAILMPMVAGLMILFGIIVTWKSIANNGKYGD